MLIKSIQNLINLSKNGSVGERTRIEYLIFKIQTETITKLQSLGYLPVKSNISPNVEDQFNKLVEHIKIELRQIEDLTDKFKEDVLI